MEKLRFTPGWGRSTSDEYWSYAFLWFIEGKHTMSADILQEYLQQYFNGLYLTNLKDKTNAPSNFTEANIQKIASLTSDQQTFEGTVVTLDFLTGNPINFNVRIHIRNYKAANRTAFLYEISPQAYTESAWIKLDEVVGGFK